MATKEKVLGVLAAQPSPTTIQQLAKVIGEAPGNFHTQLTRMAKTKPPLVIQDEDKKWSITEEGIKYLEAEEDDSETPPQEVLKEAEQPTTVISDYQKFMQLGRQSGIVNKELLKATCDHVWRGGDYTDLEWVHAALSQANIQPDVANRWTAYWSSHLKVSLTPKIREIMDSTRSDGRGGSIEGKPMDMRLTHVINPDNGLPLYVGEGAGDYTYKDALEISKQFLASRGRGASIGANSSNQTSSDPYEVAMKLVQMINDAKSEAGVPPPAKNYIVKIDADGNASVDERDPSKPMIVQTKPLGSVEKPPAGALGLTNQVNEITALVQALASLGIVKLPGSDSGNLQQVKYVYLDNDGKPIESQPGQPIVIYKERPISPSSNASLTLQGQDGKDVTFRLDQLDTLIRIEDWKNKTRREEESHQNHQDLIKDIRKALPDVIKGAGDYFSSSKKDKGGDSNDG
ncbi:MAG: hypothetical protein PHU23_01165 [Dehalococcoidales bacterium]|nr:hypothetical protein [Dehalococcoidales bacterium]